MWDLLGLAFLTKRKDETVEQSFWSLIIIGFFCVLFAVVFIVLAG